MQGGDDRKKFKPGEMAPITGVYRVIHGTPHREPHEVVIIRGEQLPICRTCKQKVSFVVAQAMSHVTHDWDFSGPHNLIIRPKDQAFQDFRMFSRMPIQLPVTLEFPDSASRIHGQSSDLSAGGVGAIIQGKLPSTAKRGVVRIDLPRRKEPLSFPASLRYQSGLRCGFEFVDLGNEGKESIRQLIHMERLRTAELAG